MSGVFADDRPFMEKLDDSDIEQVAAFFSAFAVPTRLRILNALRHGERNVGEIAAAVGCGQANTSKHLQVLAQKGLIEKSSRGTSAYYRIADPRVYELCDLVCAQIGRSLTQQLAARDAFIGATRSTRPARRRVRR